MSQDNFNKLVSTTLLVFCMIMFALSWYTGKNIDLQGFMILMAPILTHLGHLVVDNTYQLATIKKDTAIAATNGALVNNTAAVEANTAAHNGGSFTNGNK